MLSMCCLCFQFSSILNIICQVVFPNDPILFTIRIVNALSAWKSTRGCIFASASASQSAFFKMCFCPRMQVFVKENVQHACWADPQRPPVYLFLLPLCLACYLLHILKGTYTHKHTYLLWLLSWSPPNWQLNSAHKAIRQWPGQMWCREKKACL